MAEPTEVDKRNKQFWTFLAENGITSSDVNHMVERIRRSAPFLGDGECRSALYAMALAGLWPQPLAADSTEPSDG